MRSLLLAVVVRKAGTGGPLYQGAGERGLRAALRLTRGWPSEPDLAMLRAQWFRTRAKRAPGASLGAPCPADKFRWRRTSEQISVPLDSKYTVN
jgi:hypothetical protein